MELCPGKHSERLVSTTHVWDKGDGCVHVAAHLDALLNSIAMLFSHLVYSFLSCSFSSIYSIVPIHPARIAKEYVETDQSGVALTRRWMLSS
jgi:hypothetical protein